MTTDLDAEHDESVPLRPPLTTTTSIKPAATVLVLGVVMLVVFLLINGLFDQGTTTTTTVAVVGGLPASSSRAVISGCINPDTPSNIEPSMVVPVGTTAAGPYSNESDGPGQFDCSRELRASHSQNAVLGFYKSHFVAQGWTLFSTGLFLGKEQMLFDVSGTDGFSWEAGVTIDAHSATSASWTLDFHQSDAVD